MPKQSPQERKLKMEKEFDKMKSDYEAVFSSPAGQRVLEDIKKSGYFYRSTFNIDALSMAKNEGIRTFALHVVDLATPKPEENKENKKAITGGSNE